LSHKVEAQRKEEQLQDQQRLKNQEVVTVTEESENKDEMYQAAETMTKAASEATTKLGSTFPNYTTEGKLFDSVREVGRLMTILSFATKTTGNQTLAIATAREISNVVKNISTLANSEATFCTEPILKSQLLNSSQAANSSAVQLKIIAAVKATTETDNTSTTMKTQLVKCCKNLAAQVVKTVEHVEIAAIKSLKFK